MKKQQIKIASGIKYLTEIKGFELPNGVFNKTLTGCGASTLAIVDNNPTVICSPRVNLIISKTQQHSNLFWFKHDTPISELKSYLANNPIPKIIVTFDSLWKLNYQIDMNYFRVVIDEFQRLLTDSSFKSETEIQLIRNLQKYKYVTYLSATPILDKYLDQIKMFEDVTYYEAVWEESDYVKVELIKSPNPKSALVRIINQYKANNFLKLNDIESKEAVFYINSVTTIVNLIKTCDLKPEECNILCANSDSNLKLVKKLGAKFELGTLPNKGDAHKMFTFCTSAVYDGVDMYSECASTYVISDYRTDNLLMDIRTDLVQIAGRQRLESNPFSNTLTFIYKEGIELSDISKLKANADDKLAISKLDVEEINVSKVFSVRKLEWLAIPDSVRYVQSYKMLQDNVFITNEMVYLNELYKIDLYEDFLKYGIQTAMKKDSRFHQVSDVQWKFYTEKIKYTIEKTDFIEKMQAYCDAIDNQDEELQQTIEASDRELSKYYNILGADRIKALGCQKSKLDKEITFKISESKIANQVYDIFNIGDRVSNTEIKNKLSKIYKKLNIKGAAKAIDINNFYNTSVIKVDINGARKNGYELINKIQ